jgi:predicted AAA+ superfamily ATPase
MLDELVAIHQEVMATTPTDVMRYLYPQINWKAKGLCIVGDRGVGKTTLLCQDLLLRYKTPERALYLSADHVNVISYGLVNIAQQFFSYGGEALYIDEVHKYPEWSTEIKNICDAYKGRQVIFSASSSLDLNRSKGDLSRRIVYHRLHGLSFREYLLLAEKIDLPMLTLSDLLHNHLQIASNFSSFPILKYFREYLQHGYYPFFLEGLDDYLSKCSNIIEKVLFEDVAVVYNLKQTTLPILKRLLWLVATSNGLIPNVDKMSKNLGVSREMVYNCLEYLNSSGLLNHVFPAGKGNALIRKPGKIYLSNTNLLQAIQGSLKFEGDVGAVREMFFVNQVGSKHKVTLHERGDFLVDEKYVVEVGGKGKNTQQIQNEKNAYLALDDLKIGFGNKIPLYLFGFLY